MAYLGTTAEFEDDLDALHLLVPQVVELVDALLEELGQDQECLKTLAKEVPKWVWSYTPPFEIKRFHAAWQQGRRVYVLKPYDEDGHKLDYRLFLGHDITTDEFFVLSISHRGTCYDTQHTDYQQLCARYDRLEFPAMRGQ